MDFSRVKSILYDTIPNPDYHNLPSEYQELEYILNEPYDTYYSGAYIDTQYKATSQDKIITTFEVSSKRIPYIFGGESTYNSGGVHVYYTDTGSERRIDTNFFVQRIIVLDKDYENSKYTVEMDKHSTVLFYDGIEIGRKDIEAPSEDSNYSIYLFALHRKSVLLGSYQKIYLFEIEDKRKLIPCYRKSDGVAGMYDLCGSICPLTNSPFYINAGNGTFKKGPSKYPTLKRYVNIIKDNLGRHLYINTTIPNVLWLDGIKNTRNGHSDTTTVWEDLTNNHYDFTIAGGTPNWNNNGYQHSTTETDMRNEGIAIMQGLEEFTIEVVAKALAGNDYGWIFQNRTIGSANADGFQFYRNSNSYDFVSTLFVPIGSQRTNNQSGVLVNISSKAVTYKNGMITHFYNGTEYNKQVDINYQDLVNSILTKTIYNIGSSYPWTSISFTYPFNGYIYAIRIHDKALTKQELTLNWQSDLQRFKTI